jgi:hypothetical protein
MFPNRKPNLAIYAIQECAFKPEKYPHPDSVKRAYPLQFISTPSLCQSCFEEKYSMPPPYSHYGLISDCPYECRKLNAKRVFDSKAKNDIGVVGLILYRNPKAYAEWLANEQETEIPPNLS